MKHFSIKTISLSTLLGALLLTGCGEAENDTNSTPDELHEVIVPKVSNKLQRADNVNQNRDINLQLSISDTKETLSFVFKGNTILETDRGVTYIDADNNPATGYRRGELGAEYLLIGSALYKNAGGNGYAWKWNMLGQIDKNRTTSNNETTTTLKVDKNLIQISKTIKAFSYLYDGGFNGVLATSSTILHTMSDENHGNNAESSFTATEPTRSSSLIFTITDPLVGTNKDASENIFIDIDGNTKTGYFNWYSGKLGAEYLISGNSVYRYKDARGYGWNWERIGSSHRHVNGKSVTLEMTTPDNFIAGQSKAVASMYDSGWHASKIFDQTTITDNPEDGGNGVTPKQELVKKLLPENATIESFIVTPDKRGAIVRVHALYPNGEIGRFSYAPMMYVNFTDLEQSRLPSKRFDIPSEWFERDTKTFFVLSNQAPVFLPNHKIRFHETTLVNGEWEVTYNYTNGRMISWIPLNKEAVLIKGKKYIHAGIGGMYNIGYYKKSSYQLDANPKQWHLEYSAEEIIGQTIVEYRITLIYDQELDKTYFISKVEE